MARKSVSSLKTIAMVVTLKVPAMQPPYEFLSNRVNTEMTYCGNVENIDIEETMIKMSLAAGNLVLLVDKSAIVDFPLTLEKLLNKNVCLRGFLTSGKNNFEICIKEPAQIWLSGH